MIVIKNCKKKKKKKKKNKKKKLVKFSNFKLNHKNEQ